MDLEVQAWRENENLQRNLATPLKQAELVALATRQHVVFELGQLPTSGGARGPCSSGLPRDISTAFIAPFTRWFRESC